jgi:hypothetical protein
MSDDLYETDILLWSEQQAAAIRRRAANEIDWENVAEEIETVGNEQLHAIRSHLVQALLYDLKAEAWPLSREVSHWRAEARGQPGEARERFTASMRQRIDVAKLYREALHRMPESIDGTPPLPLPEVCPVALDEMLAEPEG